MESQRNIVITGVSRGLGRALVAEFLEAGHRVTGCARSAKAVNELNQTSAGDFRFDVVDIRNEDQVAAWANSVIYERGVPDLLLNNAGLINRNAPLWQVPADEFRAVLETNVTGTYLLVRHFVPAMIERGGGVIVNFTSTWGRSTSPQVAPYCATKWAVEGMTRALADELPPGMAAIPLNPGIIHTQMLESCFGERAAQFASPEQWAKKVAPFLLQLGPEDNGDPLTAPA